jgi:hypothetical protein
MAEEIRKDIIISVKADTGDAGQKIDELGDKIKKVGDTPADTPFKNFKTQIKEATLEAAKLEQQFGKNSAEFRKAAQRVAELKDSYDEFGQSIKSFNPDNKLQSLASAARGAIVAVQGVTGAMQFLGIQSGTAEEAIAKLQGLMAFSDALGSVDDIKNAYQNFTNVIKESAAFQSIYNAATKAATAIQLAFGIAVDATSISFKVLRGAIISTGIGALVVAIGFAINKIVEWTEATDKQAEAQKELKDTLDVEFFDTLNEQYTTQIKKINDLKDASIGNAKLRGASEKELRSIEKNAYNERIAELKKQEETLRLQTNQNPYADDNENQKQALKEYKSIKAQREKEEKDLTDFLLNNQINDRTNRLALQKQFNEELRTLQQQNYLNNIQDENKRKEEQIRIDFENAQRKIKETKFSEDEKTKLLEQTQVERNLKLQELDEQIRQQEIDKKAKDDEERIAKEQETRDRLFQIRKDAYENQKAVDEAELAWKNELYGLSKSVYDTLGGLLEQGTDLQKGVAITGVLIDKAKTIYDIITKTQTANAAALTQAAVQSAAVPYAAAAFTAQANAKVIRNNVRAGINVGLVAAQGAIAIRNITSAKKSSSGGGGGGNVTGAGGDDSTAPTITATATAPQAIQDVRVTNQGQAPIRAYITDRDLRNNEQRTNFLNSISTF